MSGFNWSGIYVGVHGGAGEADADISRGSLSPVGTPGTTLDPDGGLYGILGGINFQRNNLVFGVEGDISFSDISANNLPTVPSVDIETIGTVRGRAGVAFDRLLVFGTAGVGFASVEGSETGRGTKDSKDHTDFVWSAGVDYAISQNLIGRVEYMSGSFDRESYFFPLTAPHTHDIDFDVDIVRGALIWKFGGRHHAPAGLK